MAFVGIPVKIIHEAIGHTVTVELTDGQRYRGHLMHLEDNLNCMLDGVSVLQDDGRVWTMDQVYLRGSKVRYFILPDMLHHAPMFRARGLGIGRGAYTKGRGKGKGGKGRGKLF